MAVTNDSALIIRNALSFETFFTQIPNKWLRDSRLNLKSLGALAFLISHDASFELSTKLLYTHFRCNESTTRPWVKQFEKYGYLKREQQWQNGRFSGKTWTLLDPFHGAHFPEKDEPGAADEDVRHRKLNFTSGYTQIPNKWLRDPRLRPEDLGVLCHVMSHRHDYRVSVFGIARYFDCGRNRIESVVGRLETIGYITRVNDRHPRGKFRSALWVLSDPWAHAEPSNMPMASRAKRGAAAPKPGRRSAGETRGAERNPSCKHSSVHASNSNTPPVEPQQPQEARSTPETHSKTKEEPMKQQDEHIDRGEIGCGEPEDYIKEDRTLKNIELSNPSHHSYSVDAREKNAEKNKAIADLVAGLRSEVAELRRDLDAATENRPKRCLAIASSMYNEDRNLQIKTWKPITLEKGEYASVESQLDDEFECAIDLTEEEFAEGVKEGRFGQLNLVEDPPSFQKPTVRDLVEVVDEHLQEIHPSLTVLAIDAQLQGRLPALEFNLGDVAEKILYSAPGRVKYPPAYVAKAMLQDPERFYNSNWRDFSRNVVFDTAAHKAYMAEQEAAEAKQQADAEQEAAEAGTTRTDRADRPETSPGGQDN